MSITYYMYKGKLSVHIYICANKLNLNVYAFNFFQKCLLSKKI